MMYKEISLFVISITTLLFIKLEGKASDNSNVSELIVAN